MAGAGSTPALSGQDLGQLLEAAKSMDGVKDVAVELDKNNQRGSFDCHGHNARVTGNNNVVSFSNCATVSVPGNENSVTVKAAQKLVVHGNDNKLLWRGPASRKWPTLETTTS